MVVILDDDVESECDEVRSAKAKVSDPSKFISSAGDVFHLVYSPRLNNDGDLCLVLSGKEFIPDMINSQADLCDMRTILSHLEHGDVSVLNRGQMIYGDFRQIPNTYAGVLNMVNDARKVFDQLPVEVRSRFDNNCDKWFSSIGTETWFNLMKGDDSNLDKNTNSNSDNS